VADTEFSMKNLFTISNLQKSFGSRMIFDDLSITIGEKQKIAVIGRNGAGKSTLFKIIVGDESKTSGEVNILPDTRLGYLTQHDPFLSDETVMDFLLRATGKQEWECAKMCGRFDIKNEQLTQTIGSFAGGYQMRIKLIELLLHDPNLLLLDEPTNYLDLSTLLLLEQFLKNYTGTFLLISHDRDFLRATCEQTLEIENGKAAYHPTNLDTYLAYKAEQREFAIRYNKKIAKERAHLQSFVDRFRYKASKASQAQSKLKQIERLSELDVTASLANTKIRLPQIEKKFGHALFTETLSIGYGDNIVASDITLDISRGEHIAIVGDNGQGKSTFFKTIAGVIPKLDGTFSWGNNISVGYYAQHVPSMLDPKEHVFPYLSRRAGPDALLEHVLEIAGNFLFRDDDLKKSISVLSGGEKARLCLAGLLLQKHDVLLLDEPTNHLDFETVDVMGAALKESNSTILFISHNRSFVRGIAERIIEVKDSNVKLYHHDYENYVYHLKKNMPKIDVLETPAASAKATASYEKGESKILLHKQKDLETEIRKLNGKKQSLEAWFAKNHDKVNVAKQTQYAEVKKLIEEREYEWLEVQHEIEEVEKSVYTR